MNDKELFKEVVNKLNKHGIHMQGKIVCYNSVEVFNTDGFNFEYNMARLGDLINKVVNFF